MVEFTDKKSLSEALTARKENGIRIGFVPTMGALHEGHLSLVKQALEENQLVVVSIFVNPTQFNNSEDLDKYPRTPEDDLKLLNSLGGNIWVYLPSVNDLYHDQVVSDHYDFGGIEHEMEGKHRKGHFDGVGTVVSRLFNIVNPDRAYFGEKDFQQLQIIKKLVAIKKLPVEIIGCPIIRETNGLAMSSRNKRLNSTELQKAALIFNVLTEVKEKFNTYTIQDLNELVSERFLNNDDLELEYFSIVDEETLKTVEIKNNTTKHRAFIAAYIAGVRLIDNLALN